MNEKLLERRFGVDAFHNSEVVEGQINFDEPDQETYDKNLAITKESWSNNATESLRNLSGALLRMEDLARALNETRRLKRIEATQEWLRNVLQNRKK